MTIHDMQPEFSVVIPAYNEEKLLPRALERIDIAKNAYHLGTDAVEVIVADNASTDTTASIARDAGARVATFDNRRIASARNGVAAIARGRILVFVDADTTVHPETFNAIHAAMATGNYVGGATGWEFERTSAGLAATRFVVGTVVTGLLRIDGGAVFCTREAFDAVGGYNEEKEIAEDVEFFRAVRAFGKRKGLRMLRGTPEARAVVCTRKFDKHGDWHMFYMAWWPITQRRSMKRIVEEYWYTREE